MCASVVPSATAAAKDTGTVVPDFRFSPPRGVSTVAVGAAALGLGASMVTVISLVFVRPCLSVTMASTL